MRSWRERSAPIIAGVFADVGTDDMKKLRRALSDAYPYGEKKFWPYKVWCDEIRRQLGLKPPKDTPPAERKQFYRCDQTQDLFVQDFAQLRCLGCGHTEHHALDKGRDVECSECGGDQWSYDEQTV